MEKRQERLKSVMLQVCKLTGIEYTNDLHQFHQQLDKLGLLTNEEQRRFEQIVKRIGLQM